MANPDYHPNPKIQKINSVIRKNNERDDAIIDALIFLLCNAGICGAKLPPNAHQLIERLQSCKHE